jgi:thymidylate synthase (FAD)
MNKSYVGDGKVYLIAGGGKTYADMAAKFCRSEKDVEDIIASPQSKAILKKLVGSNHKAALEFDDFIFGIEGYSRVTEIQLVRKRHASYMIKSGRNELNGNRAYDVVIPKEIENIKAEINLIPQIDDEHVEVYLKEGADLHAVRFKIRQLISDLSLIKIKLSTDEILNLLEGWYDAGLEANIPEELLRYLKPQATSFKACVMMNASALRDWFMIRMCNRAQTEIRDLVTKIYTICKEVTPELFEGAGPSCKVLGYCPEDEQCSLCKGKIPTKEEALNLIRMYYNK